LNITHPSIHIAGVGIVSPLGSDVDKTLASLQANHSGIAPLRVFSVKQQPALLVGQAEISEDFATLPRTHRLAMAAAKQAMAGQDCTPDAVVVGTTTGGISRTEKLLAENSQDPTSYMYHGLTTVAEAIGKEVQCNGERLTFSTACSSGAVAISMACRMLESGKSQWVLAGGADSLCLLTYYGFHSLQLVDKQGSRPFDISREGMSVGEGAAFLLLTNKKLKHSYGVVAGYGLSCDAHHAAAPHPEGKGAENGMKLAMDRAGIKADQVDYINLHGTGTPENDLAESKAVRRLFDPPPALSSIKGLSGHGLAASGAIEAVISVLCLKHDFLPANGGCKEVDPECGIKPLASPASQPVSTILSNSFGFGGNNACLVITEKEPEIVRSQDDEVAPLSIIGKSCITGAGHTMDSLGKFFTLESMAGVLETKIVAEKLAARSIRRLKRFSQMALALAQAAKEDFGIQQAPHGVFMGSSWGALSETYDFLENLRQTDEKFPSPLDFVGSVHNSAAGQIAIRYGATGPNLTSSGGDYSFEQAVLAADGFLEKETRRNTALVIAADEYHSHLSPLLDSSVRESNFAADGGGGFYLCRKNIPGKVSVSPSFYGKSNGETLSECIVALGGREHVKNNCAMILAGIPAAQAQAGEQQLDCFMKEVDIDVPVIHYRKFIGEFGSASAVAAVMATQLIESGEIPVGKSVLLLGFGSNCTALEFVMQG